MGLVFYFLFISLALPGRIEALTPHPNDAYFWTWKTNSYSIRYGDQGENEQVVTFNDCKGLCVSDGSDMLDIDSEDEFDMLDEEMINDRVSTFWTSGSLDSADRSFFWQTNDEEIPHSFWAENEPNGVSGNRVCVEYKWDANSEFHKLFAITPCTGYRTCLCKKVKASTKPKPFSCQSEGMFPDPHLCNAFHQCANDGRNGYTDYKMPCGAGTVFCSKLNICGWERDCPCNGRVIQ